MLRSMGIDTEFEGRPGKGHRSQTLGANGRRWFLPHSLSSVNDPFLTVRMPRRTPRHLVRHSVHWEDGTELRAVHAGRAALKTGRVRRTIRTGILLVAASPFPSNGVWAITRSRNYRRGGESAADAVYRLPRPRILPATTRRTTAGRAASSSACTESGPIGTGDAAISPICADSSNGPPHDLDASFIGLNPLHAIANRQPYNTSPYLPLCSFYKNLIYLDVEAIEDFRTSDCARRIVGSSNGAAEAPGALRDAEFVEYEQVARLKTRVY